MAMVWDLLQSVQTLLEEYRYEMRSTGMANANLATYLNDHLAGSTGAIDLIEHVLAVEEGASIRPFLAELHADVLADRQQLEALMEQLAIDKSRSRQAMAWITEKVARVKLRLDDPRDGALQLLESLEAIAIGIAGKQALWQALQAAVERAPELQGPDYEQLVRRAEEQHRRVEAARLQAATAAFGFPGHLSP
jgi:hypothetical protein